MASGWRSEFGRSGWTSLWVVANWSRRAHLPSHPVPTATARLRVTTAFLAISAGLIAFTSLEFMLEAIEDDFALTPDQTIVVGQISSGAALVAVFLVGALADRFGDRRVLEVACALAAVGALVVGLAPEYRVLLAGLCLSGIGTIAMAITGVSVLDTTFPDRARRARAFGVFAVIAPAVAIVVPLVAGAAVPGVGWRLVVVSWIAVAAATFLLARRSLAGSTLASASAPASALVEFVTPAVAGVALAGIALTASFVNTKARTDAHSTSAIISAGVGLLALVALPFLWRRVRRPSLDLRALRARGATSVFLTVVALNGVNLFFFTYLLLQYRYHQSLFDTALYLIVPQAVAAVAAILGGRLGARWGSAPVAVVALLAAAVLSLGALFVSAESSAWLPVLVLSLAAVPIAAAVGPVTQSFMELAPSDGVGSTSSLRTAAANLGVAIIGVISATIVFDDLDADTARTIDAYRQQADAFHLAGLICGVVYLTGAVLMTVHARRRVGVVPAGV